MILSTSVEKLPNTSVVTVKKLKSAEINTYLDLLQYFPQRYENFSLISPVNKVQEGETVTVRGKIQDSKNIYTKRRITIQKIHLDDGTGIIELIWYNQPYIVSLLKKNLIISASGEIKKFLNSYSMEVKEYEVIKDINQETIHTGRITPIYPEKKGLSSKTVRDKIHKVLRYLQTDSQSGNTLEWLPESIIKNHHLVSEHEAYQYIHFPQVIDQVKLAKKRLSFDEIFTIQLSATLIKREWDKDKVLTPLKLDEEKKLKLQQFIENLPFHLTNAQEKVYKDVLQDLLDLSPMNRFLQGDVGSGKTVVAAIASYFTYLNGLQILVMAPTEILAMQHYQTMSNLFRDYDVKIGILTGSKKLKKDDSLDSYHIIIGTHTLLNQKLQFNKVGLVIIDEQHRFGVAQRAMLKQKGINPHLLTMTATPIPRTVALTVYGELDLSVIDEMPKGRLPIKTYVVPQHKRTDAYNWIKTQIKKTGCQIFIICPLIEESEIETMKSVRAAKKEFEFLKQSIFTDFKVGLLHGKMKSSEKEQVMSEFKNKHYDILVSTSVVEVGIDISNASIMVIEGAERYGLAQLHQLRGRVGRGTDQSYCLLFSSDHLQNASTRLEYFAHTSLGIKLAEFDFKNRGPGDIFGTKQHGYVDLKIADLTDLPLIEEVKKAVDDFLRNYQPESLPSVKSRLEVYQKQQITRD